MPSANDWKPYRWTLDTYRKLAIPGLFDGVKVVLIRGEIFTKKADGPPHDAGLGLTDDWLRTVLPRGVFIRCQQGFEIEPDSNPLPDLAVVAGVIRDYHGRTPTAAVMIVEVAETSLFLDTTEKAELYATAGVPDYWVLDVANRQLHVFRDPVALPAGLGATAYRSHTIHSEADTVSPLAAPNASIRVAELLP